MFCANCGTKLPDEALFCPTCGNRSSRMNQSPPPSQPEPQPQPQPQPQAQSQPQPGPQAQSQTQTPPRQETSAAAGQSGVKPAPAPVHRHFPFGTIVAAIILVAAVVVWISNYQERAITDLKNVIFTQYDTGDSIGATANENMSHVQWSSEKLSKGKYDVTLTGVDDMYGALIEATFRVTYLDDTVYAVLDRATVNGTACSSTELGLVMMLIYGQLDEDTLAGLVLWDMLW